MRLAWLSVTVALLGACNASSAPRTPEETCEAACASRVPKCDSSGCERGCNFVLDRLVENQLEPVVSCMGAAAACDDVSWARCAVRVGPHADGGPPPPPPPPEEE